MQLILFTSITSYISFINHVNAFETLHCIQGNKNMQLWVGSICEQSNFGNLQIVLH